jgi:hypothetical protein
VAREVVDINAAFRLQRKTLKTGEVKSYQYRVDFKADPLYVHLDANAANGILADTLREIVKREIKEVVAPAAHATIARRRRYEAEARGATRTEKPRTRKDGSTVTTKRTSGTSRSYMTRYAGGRIGEVPPSGSVRLFNDSGRLADNLVLKVRTRSSGESVITLDCAGNRFDPRTFGGGEPALIANVIQRIQQYVPSLGGKLTGRTAVEYDRMLREVAQLVVAAGEAQRRALEVRLRQLQMKVLRSIAGLLV